MEKRFAFLHVAALLHTVVATTGDCEDNISISLLQTNVHLSAHADVNQSDNSRSRSSSPSIEIFYETQCPYSLDFLDATLRAVWTDPDLWSAMDVQFRPFGNVYMYESSELSEGYHFWHPEALYPVLMCQHGDMECLGNMIQACVMDLQDESKYVPYILCMSSYGLTAGIELASYECGKKLNIDMEQVRDCVYSEKGHDLELVHGDATRAAKVTYVPWVTVNGVHIVEGKDAILKAVCGAMSDTKPSACAAYETIGSIGEAAGPGSSLMAMAATQM